MKTHTDGMTIAVTAYNKTVSITCPDDIDLFNFLENCKNLALTIGYHEDNWKDTIIDIANEYLMEEEAQVDKNLRDYGNYTDKANPKVYTGKSDLNIYWDADTSTWQDRPTKEYIDWINKGIPDCNC